MEKSKVVYLLPFIDLLTHQGNDLRRIGSQGRQTEGWEKPVRIDEAVVRGEGSRRAIRTYPCTRNAVANLLPLAGGEIQRYETLGVSSRHQRGRARLFIGTGDVVGRSLNRNIGQ